MFSTQKWSFPQNILNEMKFITELQDDFKDLDESNYGDILNDILQSPFFSESNLHLKISRYHQFWENFHVCLRERPKSIFLFIRIIIDIFHILEKKPFENASSEKEDQNYDNILSQTIILSQQSQREIQNFRYDSELFLHIFFVTFLLRSEEFHVPLQEPQLPFLLHNLYLNGFFSQERLFSFLLEIQKSKYVFSSTKYCFLRFYSPEIEENPDYFESIDPIIKIACTRYMSLRSFEDTFEEYKKDNYANFKLYRTRLDFGNVILGCLLTDNLDTFKEKVSSHPSFHPDMVLKLPIYAPFDYLNSKPPIISAAAFLGSLSIFKYLKLLGADLKLMDNEKHTVIQFAIAGGNLEIVRILEQERKSCIGKFDEDNLNFRGALQVSCGFSRYDIFDWLLETQPYDISSVDKSRGNVIGQTCLENNMQLFVKCLEEKVDINCVDTKMRYPIMKSISYRAYDVFRLILLRPDVDLSVNDNKIGLVAMAVQRDEDWMAKMLLDDDRTVISQEDQYSITREMIFNNSLKCFRNVLVSHPKVDLVKGFDFDVRSLKTLVVRTPNSEEILSFFFSKRPEFFNNEISYYEATVVRNVSLINFMVKNKIGDINEDNGKALYEAILLNNEQLVEALLKSDVIDLSFVIIRIALQHAKNAGSINVYRLVINEMKKRNLIDDFFAFISEEEEEEEAPDDE